MDDTITIEDFKALDFRVGTILEARPAPDSRHPAYQLKIDLGPLGKRSSSARITDHYRLEDLVGRQVIALVNLPPKQIGAFQSQVLLLGAYEPSGAVRLLQPDQPIPNGARLQ